MTVLRCPLCPWTLTPAAELHAASNAVAAPAVAAALGMPAGALLSIHQHQARQRDEHAIEVHMWTHPPAEWLPKLMAREAQRDRVVALHTPVDDDECCPSCADGEPDPCPTLRALSGAVTGR